MKNNDKWNVGRKIIATEYEEMDTSPVAHGHRRRTSMRVLNPNNGIENIQQYATANWTLLLKRRSD